MRKENEVLKSRKREREIECTTITGQGRLERERWFVIENIRKKEAMCTAY
mgnify:CR=1 FL=1